MACQGILSHYHSPTFCNECPASRQYRLLHLFAQLAAVVSRITNFSVLYGPRQFCRPPYSTKTRSLAVLHKPNLRLPAQPADSHRRVQHRSHRRHTLACLGESLHHARQKSGTLVGGVCSVTLVARHHLTSGRVFSSSSHERSRYLRTSAK